MKVTTTLQTFDCAPLDILFSPSYLRHEPRTDPSPICSLLRVQFRLVIMTTTHPHSKELNVDAYALGVVLDTLADSMPKMNIFALLVNKAILEDHP